MKVKIQHIDKKREKTPKSHMKSIQVMREELYFSDDEQNQNFKETDHEQQFDQPVQYMQNRFKIKESYQEHFIQQQAKLFSHQIMKEAKDLELNENDTEFEAQSSTSDASTVKKQPIFQDDQDFGIFNYQEDIQKSYIESGIIQNDLLSKRCMQQSQQISKKRKVKSGKDRKVRQTVTKQKIALLNSYLKQYFEYKHKNKEPPLNLKQIATKLNLGYSTILHKASVFRKDNEIKPGVFLSSLTQKRKYKKSYQVENYIEKSLKMRPFYTAQSLAKFILKQFRVSYPRSIIARHLIEMGYSANQYKTCSFERNGVSCRAVRKLYSQMVQPLLDNLQSLIYVDEVAFSKNHFQGRPKTYYSSQIEKQMEVSGDDYVSVMIAMNSQKIIYYHIREGIYERQDFVDAIGQINRNLGEYFHKFHHQQIYLITDMNKIHRDAEQDNSEQHWNKCSVLSTLQYFGLKRIFLPPCSSQLNPVETVITYLKNLLSPERKNIKDKTSLKEKITNFMRVIANQPTQPFFYDYQKWLTKAKQEQHF